VNFANPATLNMAGPKLQGGNEQAGVKEKVATKVRNGETMARFGNGDLGNDRVPPSMADASCDGSP
jgi:hypothetical protein